MSNRQQRGPREPGLFIKHLKGDYSLARAYWVHNVMLGWGTALLGAYAIHRVADQHAARHVSMALFAYLGLASLIGVWSTVGAWMSAVKHLFGGRGRVWAVLAMLSLVGGTFGAWRELLDMRPALVEHWAIAQGEQPGEHFQITMRDGGRVVEFTGGVNEGAAKALDQAIADAPRVTTVLLDSPGGWMREGERMAQVVARYRLSTRVEGECASSCTLVFLAGLDRTLADRAALGFHRGRAAGQGKQGVSSRDQAEMYKAAGLPPAFVRRILATPNDDIWIPTRRELLAAGVLTR